MEAKGFNENGLSEKSREALQSETWNQARAAMKTDIQHFTDTPDIQHFAIEKVSKNDNVYGAIWGNVVREYLKTAYAREDAEVVVEDVLYKVLKRDSVTSFYDADGNTLFDVENTRLAKEYKWIIKETVEPEAKDEYQIAKSVKEKAKEKLEDELNSAKDKSFAEPIINYLVKRCAEDNGLSEDVAQKHKTWEKCFSYIYSKARSQAKGNCAAVRDDVVFEWAEDYYHKDDKAEEEEKTKKEAKRKVKQKNEVEKQKAKSKEISAKTKSIQQKKEDIPKLTLKKSSKDMEGQLDIFSLMGI